MLTNKVKNYLLDNPDTEAEWPIVHNLGELARVVDSATPEPWTARVDEETGSYYISGPPETSIVADSLTENNAAAITTVINSLPQFLDDVFNMVKILRIMGMEDSTGMNTSYFKTIYEYQVRIAQLTADPSPVPEVKTAADLTFMHVGCSLKFGDIDANITAILPEVDGKIPVVLDRFDKTIIIFSPEDAVNVEIPTVATLQDKLA